MLPSIRNDSKASSGRDSSAPASFLFDPVVWILNSGSGGTRDLGNQAALLRVAVLREFPKAPAHLQVTAEPAVVGRPLGHC